MAAHDRYHRQRLLPGIGDEGQRRLRESHALIVGCGALGTVASDLLARAGVGRLTIIDRDVVELTNLQRQTLFEESDARDGVPKAAAAEARLKRINSDVEVRGVVADFNACNAIPLSEGADVIVDGLDNFETRYLLNDLAVSRGLPYLYGGAVATTGLAMAILPKGSTRWPVEMATPCLRCIFPEAPPAGTTPTCDTAGVLASAVMTIASFEVAQTIKALVGAWEAIDRSMLSIDLWSNEWRRFEMGGGISPQCPCCASRNFEFLNAKAGGVVTSLCGRGAMQVTPANGTSGIDLKSMAQRLAPHGSFAASAFFLRGSFATERNDEGQAVEMTLFRDGRAVFAGIDDPTDARRLYSKYVGG